MGTIYIGVTADLIARLGQHCGGWGGFTERYGVTKLIRYELFADMPSAIAREKQLKRWHRDWKVGLIERDNPEWVDLAVTLGFPPVRERVARDGSGNEFRMTVGRGGASFALVRLRHDGS